MSIYKQFATNKKSEKNGVWVNFGETEEGKEIAFKLARMSAKSNKNYSKALEKHSKPVKQAIRVGMLSEKKAQEINLNVFVESILLDWKNIEGKDGKALPFNAENAKALLTDLPDLHAALESQASDIGVFKDIDLEESAKN